MSVLISGFVKKITKELIFELSKKYTTGTKLNVSVITALLKFIYLSKIVLACNKKANTIFVFNIKDTTKIHSKCRGPPINSKKFLN